jgi:hypothetical protein
MTESKSEVEVLAELKAENAKLRLMLAVHATSEGTLYGDDGELQDNSIHPFIDFKRDDPDTIQAKLIVRAQKQLDVLAQDGRAVTIDYTNWRGVRSERRIKPLSVVWGSNAFHKTEQWLLNAMDVDLQALRTFAVRDIHSWK